MSIIQAKKLLHHGCETYIAHVVDTQKEAPRLEKILIVNEFTNVFPNDLPGLPQSRVCYQFSTPR